MLARDYISRIIRTFFEALEELFNGPLREEEELEKALEHLYITYLGKSRSAFLTESPEEMTGLWADDPDYLDKCGMLAEMMYRELKHTEDRVLQKNLAAKVIFLYELINNSSADYSLLYAARILELERILAEDGK